MELELTDKKILNILQTDFPISVRPFLSIANLTGHIEINAYFKKFKRRQY